MILDIAASTSDAGMRITIILLLLQSDSDFGARRE